MERDPAATPRLLVAELEGESLVLGRHQRASSALAQGHGFQVARRLGGGRTVAAGAGRLGVLLGLPAPGALMPSPVAADKLINRYVRARATETR